MKFKDLKFKSGDFAGQDISSLPDRVVGNAAILKRRFDNIGKNVIAMGQWNSLMDALESAYAAKNIGFASTEGIDKTTVQDAVTYVYDQLRNIAVDPKYLPDRSITEIKLDEKIASAIATADKVIDEMKSLQLNILKSGGTLSYVEGIVEGFMSSANIDTALSADWGYSSSEKNIWLQKNPTTTNTLYAPPDSGMGTFTGGPGLDFHFSVAGSKKLQKMELYFYPSISGKADYGTVSVQTYKNGSYQLVGPVGKLLPYNSTSTCTTIEFEKEFQEARSFSADVAPLWPLYKTNDEGDFALTDVAVKVVMYFEDLGSAKVTTKSYDLGRNCSGGKFVIHASAGDSGVRAFAEIADCEPVEMTFAESRNLTLYGVAISELSYDLKAPVHFDKMRLRISSEATGVRKIYGYYFIPA